MILGPFLNRVKFVLLNYICQALHWVCSTSVAAPLPSLRRECSKAGVAFFHTFPKIAEPFWLDHSNKFSFVKHGKVQYSYMHLKSASQSCQPWVFYSKSDPEYILFFR